MKETDRGSFSGQVPLMASRDRRERLLFLLFHGGRVPFLGEFSLFPSGQEAMGEAQCPPQGYCFLSASHSKESPCRSDTYVTYVRACVRACARARFGAHTDTHTKPVCSLPRLQKAQGRLAGCR